MGETEFYSDLLDSFDEAMNLARNVDWYQIQRPTVEGWAGPDTGWLVIY